MENQQQTSNLFELQFDENAKSSVITMARWAMVIVIASVVGYIISIVGYFKKRSEMEAMMSGSDYEVSSSIMTTATATSLASVIVSVLIGLVLTYFLYQFASKAKSGMETMSSYEVNIGFSNFKSYFLMLGILMILGIIFFGFVMLVAIAFASKY